MPQTTRKPARFKLPARIRGTAAAREGFSARMALVDRIAACRGIETIESHDEFTPRRVEVYLQAEASEQVLRRPPPQLLCSFDRDGVIIGGLDRWERYQVLASGWGKLVDDQVCVFLPRNGKELETVWSIIQRAYDRMYCPLTPATGSMVVSTWDWPRFSRTSLQ